MSIRGLRHLQRQQERGDIECSARSAELADIRGPFPPLFCVIGKRTLYLCDDLPRRICDHTRIRLDDKPGVAFLLPGDDVIDDHRTASGNCFLYRRTSSFSDEQMAVVKNARKFISPTNYLCLVSCCGFDLRHERIGTADGHGQINTEVGESMSYAALRVDPDARYSTQALQNAYFEDVLRRARAVIGIEAAGLTL